MNQFVHSNHSAGKIVRDSSNFQNEKFIWPEGYTAVRMFTSLTGEFSCLKGVFCYLVLHIMFTFYFLTTSIILLMTFCIRSNCAYFV